MSNADTMKVLVVHDVSMCPPVYSGRCTLYRQVVVHLWHPARWPHVNTAQ